MPIRVTSNQMFRSQLSQMRTAADENYRAQVKAGSGRRIEVPSDDPVGAQKATLLRKPRSDVQVGYQKAAQATDELLMMDQSIGSMENAVSRHLPPPPPDAASEPKGGAAPRFTIHQLRSSARYSASSICSWRMMGMPPPRCKSRRSTFIAGLTARATAIVARIVGGLRVRRAGDGGHQKAKKPTRKPKIWPKKPLNR